MYLRINFKQKDPKIEESQLFPFPLDVPNVDEWEYYVDANSDCTLEEFIKLLTK